MHRYQVVRPIGAGAFGKVFLVRNKHGDGQSVVKQIDLTKMSAKEKAASNKEAALLSQMKHPNIVSFVASFHERGSLFIVMEFCDGGDLMNRIMMQRGVLLSEEQILSWFVQICLGLKHIHDRKILHRDVKTQNIFLTDGGMKAKLGDFGIARMLNHTMELVRTCVGTPHYLSPEICESRPYNNKTDIWSLGCVLYELCTLRHPFGGRNLRQLVSQICRGRYSPAPDRYSAPLRLLLTQLFKVNPRDRPSVSSVLRRPFLQKHVSKHLETQEELKAASSVSLVVREVVNAAEKIQSRRGAQRPGGRGPGGAPTTPGRRIPLRVHGPVQWLHPRGGGASDRDGPQQIHRSEAPPPLGHYQNCQMDVMQGKEEELQEGEEPWVGHAPRPAEPHKMVAAALQEYLQRRAQANHYKLRAEKQLGLRPCTGERRRRSHGEDRPDHAPQDRRQDGEQEYLRQFRAIRAQYQQEIRHMRLRSEAESQWELPQKHGTFMVLSGSGADEPQEVAPVQDLEVALQQVRADARDHTDKRGIMFQIPLEDPDATDGGEGQGAESEEGAELEEGEGQGAEPLNCSPSFQRGESLRPSNGWRERRRWSPRAPHTLLDALAHMDLNYDTGTETEHENEEEEKQEVDSDVEVDEERLEPRSDDDDTNFEESDDEMKEPAPDSMRNLLSGSRAEEEEGEEEEEDGEKDREDATSLQHVLAELEDPGSTVGTQDQVQVQLNQDTSTNKYTP